jgi:hypothetical protein
MFKFINQDDPITPEEGNNEIEKPEEEEDEEEDI